MCTTRTLPGAGWRQRSVVTEPARQPTNTTRSACSTRARVSARAAVAADHAERQRMVLGDAALTADRGGHGRVEQLGERAKLRLRAGDHRTAAADEQRAFGGQDRLCRGLDRCRVGRRTPGGIRAEGGVGVHCRLVDRVPLHVERQADVRRAGPARGHVAERARAPRPGSGRRGRSPASTWSSGRNSASWSSSVRT